MTQFFSYWGGPLPSIANLHFRSFVHFHPSAKYDLWLNEDVGWELPEDLRWIIGNPQIEIRPFSLERLVNKYVRPLNTAADSIFFDFLRWLHRKKILRHINIGSYYHPLFKVSYKHSSPLFSYKKNIIYKGDLARCIIPVAYYDSPSCYVDLDICFLSNLENFFEDLGFLYQWEDYNFANSAVLYSPNLDISSNILKAANSIECCWPWYLFSNSICQELGIKIYPANRFDAMWDKSSLLSEDAMKFFVKSPQSQRMVDELFEKKYIVNHWHNNWRTKPEDGSPYDLLMKMF